MAEIRFGPLRIEFGRKGPKQPKPEGLDDQVGRYVQTDRELAFIVSLGRSSTTEMLAQMRVRELQGLDPFTGQPQRKVVIDTSLPPLNIPVNRTSSPNAPFLPATEPNPLSELGLDPKTVNSLTVEQRQRIIDINYRAQVMFHHPDHGGDPEKFKRVQQAYDKLQNNP